MAAPKNSQYQRIFGINGSRNRSKISRRREARKRKI